MILRSNLWNNGVTLSGPKPQTLVVPVTPDELQQATLAGLHGWAVPILADPARIDSRGYQCYIVLTLCRMLYTLQYCTLTSKPAEASWAQGALGEPWSSLIEQAWIGRQNLQTEIQPDDINGTLEFFHYTLEHCH